MKESVSCAIKHLSVYHAYLDAIHKRNDKKAKDFCPSFFLIDSKQKAIQSLVRRRRNLEECNVDLQLI